MADQRIPDIELAADNLYREETISDRRAGSIRKLIPITREGEDDPSRKPLFEGYTSLLTPAGSLPIHFELEVDNLSQALEQFPAAAKAAVERTMQELQEMRRESESGLYVPGQEGGGPAGGQPGGGRFQL